MAYDVIVVGSGMGGLIAASLCSLLGKKVLVIEKFPIPGGFTLPFKIKGKEFNAGLHCFNWPSLEQENYKAAWEILSNGEAPWEKLPYDMERYVHDGYTFIKKDTLEPYRNDLYQLFPSEKNKIDKYFKDIKIIAEDMNNFCFHQCMRSWWFGKGTKLLLGNHVRNNDRITVREYFDTNDFSMGLQNHLSFFWDNYGLPPSMASFSMHATMAWDSLNGYWHQAHSNRDISKALLKRVTENGGDILSGQGVTRFLVKNKKIQGVETEDEQCYEADSVISTIGIYETYSLLPEEFQIKSLEVFKTSREHYSFITVQYCLDGAAITDPNVPSGYYFVYHGGDTVDIKPWTNLDSTWPPYLNYVNLGDDRTTAQVFIIINVKEFQKWSETTLKNREDDYLALKSAAADNITAMLDHAFPGFSKHITYRDVSTPLTINHYTSHLYGLSYGFPSYPGRFNMDEVRPGTAIKGLFLGGQDVCTPSVIGAFIGGVMSVITLTKKNPINVLLKKYDK